MSGIFISYRREDSAAHAGRLHDRLAECFGPDQVFMDVDDIAPGADFARQIDIKVGSCDAMIAVIGKNWLSARDESGRLRLSDPGDFVGLEIALALQRNILVIPVLVGGASMPRAEELRTDVRELGKRNALTLSDADFHRDSDLLIRALEKVPGLNRRNSRSAEEDRSELRKRLFRRLLWKVPAILLLVSFALWWESSKRDDAGVTVRAPAIAGRWSGEVVYPWGARYTETFVFRPEGERLFGTAGFLGRERAIENGMFDVSGLAFEIRFEEVYGSDTRQRRNRYRGTFSGDRILINMQDDSGDPPTEWTLTRSASR